MQQAEAMGGCLAYLVLVVKDKIDCQSNRGVYI